MPLPGKWFELSSVNACRGTDKQNPVFLCAYMNTPQSAHGRVVVRVETPIGLTQIRSSQPSQKRVSRQKDAHGVHAKACLCSWENRFCPEFGLRLLKYLKYHTTQQVHYPFRLPYQMENLFLLLTIHVIDMWKSSRVDSAFNSSAAVSSQDDTSESEQFKQEHDSPAVTASPEVHNMQP